MYVIELSDAELHLLEEALEAYLAEFGHDEADTERRIKTLMARVKRARVAALDASQA